MIMMSYDDLDMIIQNGNTAYQYAWDHYEELAARPCVHTLYGPASREIGALSPSHITTSAMERRLQRKPRSGRYVIYELDGDFKVVRVKHMDKGNRLDCTYHVFELNGITYARSFFQDKKVLYKSEVVAIRYSDGKPDFFAITGSNRLTAEFYEYLTANSMLTTTYTYYPHSKITSCGVPMSFDAPIGAPESPAWVGQAEEEIHYIEFSRWFD